MRVKEFDAYLADVKSLEKEINKFIEDKKVIDIKYIPIVTDYGAVIVAMIMYKEEK